MGKCAQASPPNQEAVCSLMAKEQLVVFGEVSVGVNFLGGPHDKGGWPSQS